MANDLQDIRVDAVNLILGPKGITIDKTGKIAFDEPEILQALVAARSAGARALADDTNYFNCGSNNYQCK